jgi:hypothetical protein
VEGEVRDKWRTMVATASGDVSRVRDMAWAQWRMAVAPPSQSTSRPRECAHLLREIAPLAWTCRGCGVAFHPAASQSVPRSYCLCNWRTCCHIPYDCFQPICTVLTNRKSEVSLCTCSCVVC